ncbi:MAG: class I SAM-dependent methyltransferase [Pseudomonadota bacterium]
MTVTRSPSLRSRLGDALVRLGMRIGAEGTPVVDESVRGAEQRVRLSGERASRSGLIRAAQKSESVLEIGPFHAPALSGANVFYFDLQPTEELIARVRDYGLPTGRVPEIQFSEPTGDLSGIERSFAAVFSSHCIEHQPSLVRHLQQVSELLEPGGAYYLIAPDKRYCFDHYLPLSTLGGVVEAHREGRRVHSIANLIDARTLLTHNQKLRHWTDDHGDPPPPASADHSAQAALAEYDGADGAYIDIHAWRFTPERFLEIIRALGRLGLTDFTPERVFETRPGELEFTAVLRKPG